ncbi:MAG: hypothetical protein WC659_01810 [Patescibacteria group bacterium]
MHRKYALIACISLILVTGLAALVLYRFRVSAPLRSVREFGPLTLGSSMPLAGPGDWTFAPYKKIPESDFYVLVVQYDNWCIQASCSLDGALVQTMGGWLQGETTRNFPDLPEIIGFDREENRKVKSIVVIGDSKGRIAGIYPNKGMEDLIPVLKLHPDIADFSLLNGVDAFGPLKVGEPSPVQPGNPTGYQAGAPTSFPYIQIPAGKKFYVFSFQQELTGTGYCAFWNCITSNYGYRNYTANYVEDLGGWWSSDGLPETARKFGLDPNRVAKGEASLVVVTDPSGAIVAIHPNKTIRDILSILRQLPELADVERLFGDRADDAPI